MSADDRIDIEPALVRRLINMQFPQWANLPIRRVDVDGWDNSTFRLGDEMLVRLPTAARYVAQVEKEHHWLPRLAPLLPLAIPMPLVVGTPAMGYPWPWSVFQWLEGETASPEAIADLRRFAIALAQFLLALQRIDADDGPPAGPHNFFRGGPLTVYDSETGRCLELLQGDVDTAAAIAVWDAALAAKWSGPAVWVHGDVAAGNLLVTDRQLSAVIDFGSCAVGDPACDMVIMWTLLTGESRHAFRAAISADDATWARARGWALWKALLVLVDDAGENSAKAPARRVIADILAEHRRATRPSGATTAP